MRIGVLHPGEMGVTVAQALLESGHEPCWISDGRSRHTRQRAASFTCFDSLPELLVEVAAVISVCPPHVALEQARRVMDVEFPGIYVDANAVAPATSAAIAAVVGTRYVDGGIVGPPALRAGTTRLYLSGPAAKSVAAWFSAGSLEAIPVAGGPTAASALKMAYAAYTKGAGALLLAVNALAGQTGIRKALMAEWQRSQPGLNERSLNTAAGMSHKAWRFVGEMKEIARTFHDAGLPEGFHQAAADIFERLAEFKDQPPAELDNVLDRILDEARDPLKR